MWFAPHLLRECLRGLCCAGLCLGRHRLHPLAQPRRRVPRGRHLGPERLQLPGGFLAAACQLALQLLRSFRRVRRHLGRRGALPLRLGRHEALARLQHSGLRLGLGRRRLAPRLERRHLLLHALLHGAQALLQRLRMRRRVGARRREREPQVAQRRLGRRRAAPLLAGRLCQQLLPLGARVGERGPQLLGGFLRVPPARLAAGRKAL